MEQLPLTEIAKGGLLAAYNALFLWIGWKLYLRNVALSAELVSAWKSLGEIIRLNSDTISGMTVSGDARTRSAEAIARSTELAAATQTRTAELAAAAMSGVERQLGQLITEVQGMRRDRSP